VLREGGARPVPSLAIVGLTGLKFDLLDHLLFLIVHVLYDGDVNSAPLCLFMGKLLAQNVAFVQIVLFRDIDHLNVFGFFRNINLGDSLCDSDNKVLLFGERGRFLHQGSEVEGFRFHLLLRLSLEFDLLQ